MIGTFSLITVLALAGSIWYLFRWLFVKKTRKPIFKKRFIISIVAFFTCIFSVGYLTNQQNSAEAARLGFVSTAEYTAAKNENISDPLEWNIVSKERVAAAEARAENDKIEADRIAKLEAAKAAAAKQLEAEKEAANQAQLAAEQLKKDEACRRELTCWGEKAGLSVSVLCEDFIERFAKYDFEWTDGILEPKFSHYRWRDIDAGIVTILGDKIKFQNGFGAWTYMTYECDVNPANNQISDVRVKEGRI